MVGRKSIAETDILKRPKVFLLFQRPALAPCAFFAPQPSVARNISNFAAHSALFERASIVAPNREPELCDARSHRLRERLPPAPPTDIGPVA